MTSKSPDILLTGASGVIGRAIARRLHEAGYRVHLAGRERRRLIPLASELSTPGIPVPIYTFDLSDLASGQRTIAAFFRNAKNPYGLLCNAGHLGPIGPFWTIPVARWRQALNDNFLSHATMIHAFAKSLAARKEHTGSIVVSSGAGVGGAGDFATVTSYSTAKAAMVHLVEALSDELRDLGIRINAIAPGAVLSPMTDQALRAGRRCNPKFLQAARRCAETGGVSPDLAARMAELLLSPKSRGISGRLLSARFDYAAILQKRRRISRDPHWYRLRRIDYELFEPRRR